MSQSKDIEQVTWFLETYTLKENKEAFQRILENTIPELPDNHMIEKLYEYKTSKIRRFVCKIIRWHADGFKPFDGDGETIREAVSNTLEKIKHYEKAHTITEYEGK